MYIYLRVFVYILFRCQQHNTLNEKMDWKNTKKMFYYTQIHPHYDDREGESERNWKFIQSKQSKGNAYK